MKIMDNKTGNSIFLRNSTISLIAYILSTLLALGFNITIARLLGPEGSGSLTILLLFSVTTGLFINFGLGQAAVYFFGKKKYSSIEISSNLFSASWIIGLPILFILAISLPLYRDEIFHDIPDYVLLSVIFLTPLILGKIFYEYIFAGMQNFLWSSGANIIELSIRILLVFAFLPFNLGFDGVVLAIVISTIITAIVSWNKIRQLSGGLRININQKLLSNFTKYGLSSYTSVLITYLNLRLDQFLISFFLTLDQLGIYMVAVIVAELPMKLSNAVTKVLFAQVASISAENATTLTNRTMRIIMTLATILALLLAMIGSRIIILFFGSEFSDAGIALLFLLPGAIFFNFTQVLYSDFLGRGKPQIGIYTSLLSFFITLLGGVLLIPALGIKGAAITSSFSYIIAAIIMLWAYLRTTKQSLRQVLWINMEDVKFIFQLVKKISKKKYNI